MSNQRRYAIPELYPQPKQIILTEGDSELSTDIRLVTSNVLPIQRKAVRSILTSTGIKVVANKKKYVVEAAVLPEENFDLSEVPLRSQQEYYELEISHSEVHIKAPHQEGTVWAAQTLAGLYRRFNKTKNVPNLIIKDWPTIPTRGIFVENTWGPDRMAVTDWYQTIDAIAQGKLNTLGVGLYGCWGANRFEGPNSPAEFLLVPNPSHEELVTPHRLRWYSPTIDDRKDQTYLSPMFEEDFFADVVTYGRERGIAVVPYLNSLAHNTLIPRLLPDLSAKDKQGNPSATGYCLSNPKLKDFITDFYGGIIDRYYPTGLETFHIQMDEVYDDHPNPQDPLQVKSPWCECPECRKKTHAEHLQEYIIWLAQFLVSKGVKHIVLWNDTLTKLEGALTPEFVEKIEATGLKDHLIFDFWNYDNRQVDPTAYPEQATQYGLHAWASPMTSINSWSNYTCHLQNIGLVTDLGYKQNAEGSIAYAVHNPSHLDHEAILAAATWENTGETPQEYLERWAVARFFDDADNYLKATRLLTQASDSPAFHKCLFANYATVKDVWPRLYPGEALDGLMEAPEANLTELQQDMNLAKEAETILAAMAENTSLDEQEKDCIKSLRAEAFRIVAITKAFRCFINLKLAFRQNGGMIRKAQIEAVQQLKEDLVEAMTPAEKLFPVWLAPAALAALTLLLDFTELLEQCLTEWNGRKKAADIVWDTPYVPPAPVIPSEDEDAY